MDFLTGANFLACEYSRLPTLLAAKEGLAGENIPSGEKQGETAVFAN